MAVYSKEKWDGKKVVLMENIFEGFSELGLHGTGLRALTDVCDFAPSMIYTYFDDLDDILVQATEHCMSRVEDEFMQIAPKDFKDLDRFLEEVPHWTAEKHGKKYRLMYQVYTHPKYREHGKKFFDGVNKRYSDYAGEVAEKIGLPLEVVRPMIFTFVRACVHFALFEDEFYLNEQIKFIKDGVKFYSEKYNSTSVSDSQV